MTPNKRWILVLFLAIFTFAMAACRSKPATDDQTDSLVDLDDIAQLQTVFEADEGKPRLLLVLAPT